MDVFLGKTSSLFKVLVLMVFIFNLDLSLMRLRSEKIKTYNYLCFQRTSSRLCFQRGKVSTGYHLENHRQGEIDATIAINLPFCGIVKEV